MRRRVDHRDTARAPKTCWFLLLTRPYPPHPPPPPPRGPQIKWGACPEGQGGRDCASIPLPQDPDDPRNPAVVRAFVRRFYAGAAATSKSLWMIPGGPGDSAQSFAGGAEFLSSRDPRVTVYLMDQRGR